MYQSIWITWPPRGPNAVAAVDDRADEPARTVERHPHPRDAPERHPLGRAVARGRRRPPGRSAARRIERERGGPLGKHVRARDERIALTCSRKIVERRAGAFLGLANDRVRCEIRRRDPIVRTRRPADPNPMGAQGPQTVSPRTGLDRCPNDTDHTAVGSPTHTASVGGRRLIGRPKWPCARTWIASLAPPRARSRGCLAIPPAPH